MSDRIWVNEERTVLVRLWESGVVEVARRDSPDHTWGPPVYLEEEVAPPPPPPAKPAEPTYSS